MERVIYDRMAALDERHWWYRARRRVLAALIERRINPSPGSRILEVGCGTGHNVPMLERFGSVDAVELDAQARAFAERRLGRKVLDAPLPRLEGIPRATYDLVAAFDVVEHVDDDSAAVAALAACVKPGGSLLLTVPAHQWMWSVHDELNHHKRRYSRARLRSLVEGSPLQLKSIGYFNSILFPVAVAARLAGKLTGGGGGDEKLPPAPINALFERLFAAERRVIGRLPLPLGLSLFAVASAPSTVSEQG